MPELERDNDGASESMGMANVSKSGIDCIDDTAAIPSESNGSDGGAPFMFRAEARWARLAELLTERAKEEEKRHDVTWTDVKWTDKGLKTAWNKTREQTQ